MQPARCSALPDSRLLLMLGTDGRVSRYHRRPRDSEAPSFHFMSRLRDTGVGGADYSATISGGTFPTRLSSSQYVTSYTKRYGEYHQPYLTIADPRHLIQLPVYSIH